MFDKHPSLSSIQDRTKFLNHYYFMIEDDEDDEDKEWIDEMGMYYSTLEDALDEIIKTKYDLDESDESNESSQFDVNEVAQKIKWDVQEWKGNCYGVANACNEAGVVNGKLRYGHYTGPIHKNSLFKKNIPIGFCQHGWIELPGNQIFDPTRWVFENKPPYIYVGKNDYYDVGGNKFREATRTEPPKYLDTDKKKEVDIPLDLKNFINEILKDTRKETNDYTLRQLMYLANTPPRLLEPFGKEIFTILKDNYLKGFIPLDNWELVMESNNLKHLKNYETQETVHYYNLFRLLDGLESERPGIRERVWVWMCDERDSSFKPYNGRISYMNLFFYGIGDEYPTNYLKKYPTELEHCRKIHPEALEDSNHPNEDKINLRKDFNLIWSVYENEVDESYMEMFPVMVSW